MDFLPSQRIRSQMAQSPSSDWLQSRLPIPIFIAERLTTPYRRFARCAFDGFYEPEIHPKMTYVWTDGMGTIRCQFPETFRLQYLWVEIGATAPKGSLVSLHWDNQPIVKNHHVVGRSTVRGRLPSPIVTHAATLTITSSVFVPDQEGLGNDPRKLGVAVRGLVFGKRRTKYRAGLAFHRPLKQTLAKALPRWIQRGAA